MYFILSENVGKKKAHIFWFRHAFFSGNTLKEEKGNHYKRTMVIFGGKGRGCIEEEAQKGGFLLAKLHFFHRWWLHWC